MENEFKVETLCYKYNLDTKKIIKKNPNIVAENKYNEIDETINYFLNILKFKKKSIEKCPRIIYENVLKIKKNIDYIKNTCIKFNNIETCLHILACDSNQLNDTYNYILNNYGDKSLNKITTILSCPLCIITEIENYNLNLKKEDILYIIVSTKYKLTVRNDINAKKLENEYYKNPNVKNVIKQEIEKIKEIIESDIYKEYSYLISPQTLTHSKLEELKKIIESDEFKKYPDLFSSHTIAHNSLEEINKMINSEEFKKYRYLFTPTTLAHAKIDDIKKMINSDEFKKYPKLFTSETISHGKLDYIKKILKSDEFKKYPELFTSETLVRGDMNYIQKILYSDEFKKHRELFTSETIIHGKIDDIKKMINSEEFKNHRELFTSTTLAHSNLEDIKALLNMPYFKEECYKKLLTPSIIAKSKIMINKLPILFELAHNYGIAEYLNTGFIISSPSQNYAIINYLIDNNEPLIINNKLNPLFGKQPGYLLKRYKVNIKELMEKYPYNELNKEGRIK